MATITPLDVIQVDEPCHESWDGMSGGDRARFCGHCQKEVFNLSTMPRDEAERLICEQGGSLCVRFARDAAGGVLTLDYAPVKPRRRWPLWTGVSLLASLATALGLYARPRQQQANPPMVMGAMVCKTPVTPAPPAPQEP